MRCFPLNFFVRSATQDLQSPVSLKGIGIHNFAIELEAQ